MFSATAKEKLLERVTKLSEAEADETLRLLDLREDPVVVAFRDAPEGDRGSSHQRCLRLPPRRLWWWPRLRQSLPIFTFSASTALFWPLSRAVA